MGKSSKKISQNEGDMLTFHGQVMSSNLGSQGDFLIARGTPGAQRGVFYPTSKRVMLK